MQKLVVGANLFLFDIKIRKLSQSVQVLSTLFYFLKYSLKQECQLALVRIEFVEDLVQTDALKFLIFCTAIVYYHSVLLVELLTLALLILFFHDRME